MLYFFWFVRTARNHVGVSAIPSREGLTQETSYKIEGLNVSVFARRVGRSSDSDQNAASITPRDQRRRLYRQSLSRNAASATAAARAIEPQPNYLPIVLREDAFDGLFLNCEMTTNDYE